MKINSILIANRGEIACRIIRTANEMGIKTIAVYEEADSNATFVSMSDVAVKLKNGYLDADEIVDAAKKTEADAIHPGYGFLSENSIFARKVIRNNIIWIGPTPHVIKVMGDKIKAKELAIKANVPTLEKAESIKDSKQLGFPLLIKAAAGGGGKGMRIVNNKNELKDAVAAAKREAKSGFDDERVFIEKYIKKSRHIEIQILGDQHGNVIHLGERECSIQRRHQKIIEESPSPKLDDELREQIGNAAVKLAKKIKYQSAGTVEFILDENTNEFWFLEVNTRLQVEHPVTEEVTGVDLVRAQINIAKNEYLELKQNDVEFNGHALEVRLYAENPNNDFLPETGKIVCYEPYKNKSIRWDSGVQKGYEVGTNFDPMLSKVISWAPNRTDACLQLATALEKSCIGGVKTNKDFLVECIRHPEFLAGNTTSDFIEIQSPNRKKVLNDYNKNNLMIAGALWISQTNIKNKNKLRFIKHSWTNGRLPHQNISFQFENEIHQIKYSYINKESISILEKNVEIISFDNEVLECVIDDIRSQYQIYRDKDRLFVFDSFNDIQLKVLPRFVDPSTSSIEGGLLAPMPGKISEVLIKKDQKVKAGQSLMIIEAMKMEQTIKSPNAGKISKIMVKKGQQVENGESLLVIDE
ncbi:MAG: biotin/lipoyl-binding protein [SAR86 cluster bacterium]|uniref:Biotin carboxylase n=1 Tax=SAR86 cluster bacterium TaxID=2030880 RepID=A0A368BZU0_9GAMM|nr:MAG: biotin/lipoyl-binding protein [SAR86 cluster bacterium]